MPWKRMPVSEQRVRFVIRATSGRETMQGLCREFGISRPTGYLWRRRYKEVEPSRGWWNGAEAAPQPSPDLQREGTTGGGAAEGVRLGCQKTAGAAHTNRDSRCRTDDSSRSEAAWVELGKRERLQQQGNALSARLLTSYGRWTGRESMSSGTGRVTRCQFWTITVGMRWVCTIEGFTRGGQRLPGEDVRTIRGAGGHADGPWRPVVVERERLRADVAGGTTDRAGDQPALRASAPSTDAGESGSVHRTLAKRSSARVALKRWRSGDRHWSASSRSTTRGDRTKPWGCCDRLTAIARVQSSIRLNRHSGSIPRQRGAAAQHPGVPELSGSTLFVSEALASRWVRVEHLDGKVLLSYRHMYVREIDLASEITRPVVFPRERQRGADVRVASSGRPPGSLGRHPGTEELILPV